MSSTAKQHPLQVTEVEFVSRLRSLAVEDESTKLPDSESFAPSVRRGTRARRPTWKVRENQLEEAPCQAPSPVTADAVPPTSRTASQPASRPASRPASPLLPFHRPLRSAFNKFGLSRFYPIAPSTLPDPTEVVFEEGTVPIATPTPPERRRLKDILKPYPNLSSFLFDHQFWTSSGSKSRNDRNALRDVVVRDEFNPSDLKGVNFESIEKDLKKTGGSGWRETLLTINVPKGVKLTKAAKRAAATEQSRLRLGEPSTATLKQPVPGAPITVRDFQHRRICDIIRETFASDPAARSFHYHPYELKWKPPGSDSEERVHGELYNSEAWLEEDARVQSLTLDPSETDKDIPRAIAAMMLASDATGLGQFSTSKAWPIYIYFGNQSKYDRAKPTQNAAHHLAYLPSVSCSPCSLRCIG